jgi:iron complex outermembrane receptor protein
MNDQDLKICKRAGAALTSVLLATTAYSGAALAQAIPSVSSPDTATTTPADDKQQLTDIVVTAQRRTENVQDAPVSVNAFSADTLRATGVTSALQLSQIDPSLNISFNADTAYPFIRGIGNIAAGVIGNEASVGTYIDNVYYARLFSALLDLGDVQHVEVLKGPQGTLFGRNTSGGAIQIFTKDPGHDKEFEAAIGYGNYNTFSGRLYAAMPVTDTFSWSIAASGHDQRSGWGNSLVDGSDVYLGSAVSVRSKAIWEPTASTKIKAIGYFAYSDDDFGNVHDIIRGSYEGAVPYNGTGTPVTVGSLADSGQFYDSRQISKATPARNTMKTWGGSLEVDQDLAFAQLVSISAYRSSKGHAKNQVATAIPGYISLPITTTDRQFSQEIQLKSLPSSTIKWILGAYYLHYYSGYDPYRLEGDYVDGLTAVPGSYLSVTGLQKIDSYAGFGQATVPVTDTTNVTVGARYSIDDLKGFGRQTLTIPGVGTVPSQPAGISDPYTNSKTFRSFTWRLALDQHLSDDVMAYTSVSRGFKAGTYNTAGLVAPPAQPEIVTAYELGLKTELFDRRVRLNGALFWNEIKDPQVQTAIQVGDVIAIGLTNAEKARTRGVEFSGEVLAAKGLTLRTNVVYLDAKFKKFTTAPVYTGGLEPGTTLTGPFYVDRSGATMVNAPKWRITGGANYSVETDAGDVQADVNVAYTSRYYWTIQNVISQKPMALVNASLSFSPTALDGVTFRVWGRNLTGVKYDSWVQESAFPNGTGGYQREAAAPRMYGGEVSVRF